MNQLHQLVTEIAEARRQRMLPSLEAVDRWHDLAQATLTAMRGAWLREPAFRLKTGASAKWCRAHFAKYEAVGLARVESGKRWWHEAARPVKARPTTAGEAADEIATSYRASA